MTSFRTARMACREEKELTGTSPAGNPTDRLHGIAPLPETGFTLLEMMVVISLISITLFFAIPRLPFPGPGDDIPEAAGNLARVIRFLKQKAPAEQMDWNLLIDLDRRAWWVVPEKQAEEKTTSGETIPVKRMFPDPVKRILVHYPGGQVLDTGVIAIRFYRQGYSTMARIELLGIRETARIIEVEPFLPTPRIAGN